ncbi:nicotinate-nucleotide adenylyltransferase [Caloranaerobacter azorensis]|uniref:Probable nicotinate-nucleotide adenylyltransferase n=1 Tax=Caloranaerobacter azorensis TaxID=116090 RepID=A0A6P1YBD5_9FIRM|nr:nicotinate-nucleotide adenylyltransferase [Caloranaerobacter azorensis]QIB26650.1 nicotinate-nucleotide adenylyltransferase [Caloranaerobacter azorensis]
MNIDTLIELASKKGSKEKIIQYNNFKRIGIMGGTFDPIHIGHLVIAEEIRNEFKLDKIIFIPAGNPPHKDNKKITPAKHRYIMTLLATISNPYFEVSAIEVERKGVTYTIDTIKTLREICSNDIEIYFITGADSILELHTWKNVKELLKLCNFIAATRPGFEMINLKKKIQEMNDKYGANIYTTIVTALQISSTDIRTRIKEGRTVKYLLPEMVEKYIHKNNLYR